MNRQAGFSILSFVFNLTLILVLAFNAYKIVPAFLEFNRLKAAFDQINQDSSLAGANRQTVLESLNKRIAPSRIVEEELIDVSLDDKNRPLLAVSYDKIVPLAGNASWSIHFETEQIANPIKPLSDAATSANQMNSALKEQTNALKAIE